MSSFTLRHDPVFGVPFPVLHLIIIALMSFMFYELASGASLTGFPMWIVYASVGGTVVGHGIEAALVYKTLKSKKLRVPYAPWLLYTFTFGFPGIASLNYHIKRASGKK